MTWSLKHMQRKQCKHNFYSIFNINFIVSKLFNVMYTLFNIFIFLERFGLFCWNRLVSHLKYLLWYKILFLKHSIRYKKKLSLPTNLAAPRYMLVPNTGSSRTLLITSRTPPPSNGFAYHTLRNSGVGN